MILTGGYNVHLDLGKAPFESNLTPPVQKMNRAFTFHLSTLLNWFGRRSMNSLSLSLVAKSQWI